MFTIFPKASVTYRISCQLNIELRPWGDRDCTVIFEVIYTFIDK